MELPVAKKGEISQMLASDRLSHLAVARRFGQRFVTKQALRSKALPPILPSVSWASAKGA